MGSSAGVTLLQKQKERKNVNSNISSDIQGKNNYYLIKAK